MSLVSSEISFLIFLGVVVTGFGLVLAQLKKLQQSDKSFQPLLDQFLKLEGEIKGKLEQNPEIIRLKIGESLQENHLRTVDYLGRMSLQQTKDFIQFKESFQKDLTQDFEKLNKNVEERLQKISEKVTENLDEGLKKTNQTFQQIIERLTKIDEAQKQIEALSLNVVSLQDILTDKKSRGIFGEVQLQQVLNSVFGEQNDRVYQLQYKLPNGTIADSVLFLPPPSGNLVVDSKFPLENFRKMVDATIPQAERDEGRKEFKRNLKKHIDDIADKYIITGVTSEQAVLFLPAEAVFAEVHAYHHDLIEYAQKRRVWLASPTTFMAMLTTLQVVLNNLERSRYSSIIQQELKKLEEEFGRYRKRWDSLAVHIETVSKDVKDLHVTTEKISTKFQHINDVNLEKMLGP